jgi:hypothetical protein
LLCTKVVLRLVVGVAIPVEDIVILVLVGWVVGDAVVGFPWLEHAAVGRCPPRVVLPVRKTCQNLSLWYLRANRTAHGRWLMRW